MNSMGSIAALLVVMAAMMASSANAEFVLTNNCTTAITLTVQANIPLFPTNVTLTAGAGASATLPVPIPGGALVDGLLNLVQIQVGAKVYVVPISAITNLTGPFGVLTQLAITCTGGSCGAGKISIVATAKVLGQVVTATVCINA